MPDNTAKNLALVEAALEHIDANCGRIVWLQIMNHVITVLGEVEGVPVCIRWSATAKQGKAANRQEVKEAITSIKNWTGGNLHRLVKLAEENGFDSNNFSYTPPTPEELAALKAKEAEQQRQAEAEKTEQQRAAAQRAQRVVSEQTEPASPDHGYLLKKGISPDGFLQEKFGMGKALVVPLVDESGTIRNAQYIYPHGHKRFELGGRVKGCFFTFEGDSSTILICEGVATGASLHAETGFTTICGFSCYGLEDAALIAQSKYPTAKIVVCGDCDESGQGAKYANKAARATNSRVCIPAFPDDCVGKELSDFNDLERLWKKSGSQGEHPISAAIASAKAPALLNGDVTACNGAALSAKSDSAATVARLAALSVTEYEDVRKAEAKALGWRQDVLDNAVDTAREQLEAEASGTSSIFDEVEPWAEAVEGAELLTEISDTVRRFIICSPETAWAVALWVAMSWFIDVIKVAPLAVITAPEKRCGKSQLLFLIMRLVQRALSASNITAAALFRSIELWNPTLILDETDALLKDNEELRGIINSGHTRDAAFAIRTVGEDFTPARFSTWCAKVLSGIGHLSDTLMDRAIVFELRRKLPHENVERLRHADPGQFKELSSKLARFADDHREEVRQARPAMPDKLNDRAQDNWEALFAIAHIAGGVWPEQARLAALKLSCDDTAPASVNTELLEDIKAVFESKKAFGITTADLLAELCSDDERPWLTFNRGKPLTSRQLTKRLKGYGIESKTVRHGTTDGKPQRGFDLEQFEDTFQRYLVKAEEENEVESEITA